MKDCNLKEVSTPVQKIADPLTELLRNGARDLIRQAVEAELGEMLSEYEDLKLKCENEYKNNCNYRQRINDNIQTPKHNFVKNHIT